ncbi:sphingosine 1-phosphate receptor 3-like [Clytia hemisphaerica]|uniref:sphingosine 1-phosphate receptor 3-like n=1 Tax=Clytia hemisphaerica TaxID=252671 RepID=UPI0034D49895
MCRNLFNVTSSTTRHVVSSFYGITAILTALENTFCLIVLWQPSLRSKSYRILASLALSDCFVGYIAFPLASWLIQNGSQMTKKTCFVEDFYSLISIWMAGVSSCSIAFIAYDRYLIITRYSHYHTILTNRRLMSILLAYWICILPLAWVSIENVHFYAWTNFGFILVVIACLFCCYFFIWKAVKQSRRRVATDNNINNRHRQQRDVKLARKVSLIIISYLIGLTPILIFIILVQIKHTSLGFLSTDFIMNFFLVAAYFGLSNSCVNPLIYVWSDAEFRKACKRLLKIRKAQPSQSVKMDNLDMTRSTRT